ncbi:MAG: hypothetical protein K0S76_735 [Herbinix sp.]|jgi:hypothetical protein|nr:hypothetical protein [Herbinix sp.]
MKSEFKVSDFQDYIGIIDSIKEVYSMSLDGRDMIYRGMCSKHFKLIPSIYRNSFDKDLKIECNTYNDEVEILYCFIKEASNLIDRLNREDYISWMEYAQHFGAPTRLLDFTMNPLVALYFACISDMKNDGSVSVIINNNYNDFCNFNSKYLLENPNVNVKQDIINGALKKSKNYFEYPYNYIPYYFDKRMAAQSSCFMLWGSIHCSFEEMIKEENRLILYEKPNQEENKRQRFLGKIIIPSYLKREFIRKLDLFGINEKTLFPGLDSIGKYIARHYMNHPDEFWNELDLIDKY